MLTIITDHTLVYQGNLHLYLICPVIVFLVVSYFHWYEQHGEKYNYYL